MPRCANLSNMGRTARGRDPSGKGRLAREARTIEAMIAIYCRDRHGGDRTLCVECADLLDYASCRLQKCPYGAEKPPCADCPIHCYRPAYRERVREVMRHSGPRMLLKHPLLAILHTIDGRRFKGDR